MTQDTSIIAKLLNVNGMHIEKVEVQDDYRKKDGEDWRYTIAKMSEKFAESNQKIAEF